MKTSPAEAAAAHSLARREARAVVEAAAIERWRRQGRVGKAAVETARAAAGSDDAAAASKKRAAAHRKRVGLALNPLALLLRPAQEGLFAAVRGLRVAAHACDGRADPVATATLLTLLALATVAFFALAELAALLRPYLAAVAAVAPPAVGVLLIGPQNAPLLRYRAFRRRQRLALVLARRAARQP